MSGCYITTPIVLIEENTILQQGNMNDCRKKISCVEGKILANFCYNFWSITATLKGSHFNIAPNAFCGRLHTLNKCLLPDKANKVFF